MVLMLTILRCPDAAVPEQRLIQGGEYTLGRGPECDWTLLDPERVLSKRHCAVEFLHGDWQLRDLSTNGTFLNSAVEPIGRDQVLPLRNGDRVRLGVYEIECRVEDEAQYASGRGHFANAIPDPMAPPRPHGDIFSVPLPGLSPPDAGAADGHAPFLPVDFDPFAPADPGPVMPDHRPSTNDVFTPPRAHVPDILPDDWNATPLPPPAAKAAPLADPFADAPPGAPAPAPAGGDPRGADPFASAPFGALPVQPMAPPVAAAPQRDATAAHAAMDAQQAALALLFQGAGLGTPPPGLDPAAALTAAGASLRAAVEGMRQLLIARADVKREFRIEQTMLRAAGNNPVKFAATVEAAMLALLAGPGAASGIGNAAALRETVDDLNLHQIATLSATQAAARALLGRLAPEPLEAETSSGGIIPGARERRLWESYKKLHRQMIDQFDDDFDSAFGKAFARAYEEASRGG